MMLARLVIMVVTILNSYFKNIFSASLTTSGRATIIMSASSISHSTRSNDSTDKHIMQRIYNAVDTIDQANGVTFNRLLSNPLSDVNIVRAMGLIDSLSLDDIGVDDLYLKDLGSPSAFRGYSSVCLNVVTKANFHISVFVLRSPRSTLPLHDHPNMLVLSKVLHGKLKMRSFSVPKRTISGGGGDPPPVDGYNLRSRKPTPAALSLEAAAAGAVLSESCVKSPVDACWFLTPTEGNIHEFENGGEGPCIVFDVLLPPYDDEPGSRACSFYDEVPGGGLRLSESTPALPVSVAYRGFAPL